MEKHGDARQGNKTKLYHIWMGMKQRCSNPHHKSYKWYGGKGVYVCDEWEHDYLAFKNWMLDHGWKEGMEIDRIDDSGPYSPDNCRVVTRFENLNKMHKKNRKPNTTTGYYGVYYHKRKKMYDVVINAGGKRYYSGGYRTAKAAAIAYNHLVEDNKLGRPLNDVK